MGTRDALVQFPEPSTSASKVKLSEYSPGDKPWDVHKLQAWDMSRMLWVNPDRRSRATRVRECAKVLGFAWGSDRDTGECKFKLQTAAFCRVRGCPVCEWRKSLMWRARFYQALPKIQEEYPKARWVFLTLTVRNCELEELGDTLKAMNEAWGRLRKRKEFKLVDGWIRATEITRGKDGSAHPHFHCLLMVKPSYFKGQSYVKQDAWRDAWRTAMRLDYDPVVDVRAVKGDLAEAVPETFKYTAKPSDIMHDLEWLHEYLNQVHKKRLMATGGALKDVLKLDESAHTDEDYVHLKEPESAEQKEPTQYFLFDRGAKVYVRED